MSKSYLNIYKSEGQFGATVNDKDNKCSNISYIIGSGVRFGANPYFDSSDASAGDILLTNGTDKFFTTPEHYQTLKEKEKIGTGEGYMTPIGVCAIPADMTLVAEGGENSGKARVVSLANMSLKTPETGSISVGAVEGDNSMHWGDNTKILGKADLAECKNLDPLSGEVVSSGKWWVKLPSTGAVLVESDEYNVFTDKLDPKYPMYGINQYSKKEDSIFGFSPYDRSGAYFSGTYTNLKGKENTDTLISRITADWSGSTIENSYASGHCPTACSCRRYHTRGSQVGNWYLPSIGELGILWVRVKEINDSLYQIGPSLSIPIGTFKEAAGGNWYTYGNWIWSSTEWNLSSARSLDADTGKTATSLKQHDNRVRAFLAI